MKRKIVFAAIILFPAILLALTYAKEFIIVDECLDKGGSFNYIAYECDQNITHPVVPFIKRNPALLITGISSALMAIAIGFIFKSNKTTTIKQKDE